MIEVDVHFRRRFEDLRISLEQLGKIYGCPYVEVLRVGIEAGMMHRNDEAQEVCKGALVLTPEILELQRSGVPQVDIAAIYGVSESTVKRLFARAGLKVVEDLAEGDVAPVSEKLIEAQKERVRRERRKAGLAVKFTASPERVGVKVPERVDFGGSADDLDREIFATGGRYAALAALAARVGRPLVWVQTRYHRAVAKMRQEGRA